MIDYSFFVQSIAILALGLFAISFHSKTRIGILAWQLLSLVVWVVHFSLLSAWTGAALCVVNAVITGLFLLKAKNGQDDNKSKFVLYGSLLALAVVMLFVWEGYFSIFAFLGVATITIAKWQNNIRFIRLISIVASMFWIIYDIFVGSYGGIISESIIILSVVASLFILQLSKKSANITLNITLPTDMIFMQLLVNGLIAGAIYALVASGFSLIYSTCKFIHFAHGSTIAFSAYFLYFFFSTLGLNFGLSVILTIILAGVFGLLVNGIVFRELRRRKASNLILLMASFSLLIIFESLILIFFGADVKTIGFIQVSKGIEILGAIITLLQIIIVSVSLLLLIAFFFFMKKTKIGKAMRAVSDNKDVAEIVGISSEKIYSWSFVIGSAIAGIGGILVGLEQNLEPTMGTNLMIKGFTAAIIGGIGSVPGAILGSFLLGLAENFGVWYLPSGYKDAIAFVILFLFLLFRPQGILGKKK